MTAAGRSVDTAYRLAERPPSAADYARLRAAVGWGELAPETCADGLGRSLFAVSAWCAGELVGCGRVIGDGAVYFYIQDVIVLPEHQGRGLGDQIMRRILEYLGRRARQNSFVGLMAARGAEGFYQRYGFERRPADRPGMFLIWQG